MSDIEISFEDLTAGPRGWARGRAALRRLRPGYGARAEREWRAVHGMARDHPESLTRALRRREERRLAALRAALWPHDEYEAEL